MEAICEQPSMGGDNAEIAMLCVRPHGCGQRFLSTLMTGRAARELGMRVAEIMKVRVATIEMDDALEKVRELFSQAPFHHLLVVDETGQLVGILSDKDLFKALSPYLDSLAENQRDRDTLARRVHQVMTRQPVTVNPQLSVQDAARLMLEQGVSCLPVLENGQISGILTWRDLLRACVDNR